MARMYHPLRACPERTEHLDTMPGSHIDSAAETDAALETARPLSPAEGPGASPGFAASDPQGHAQERNNTGARSFDPEMLLIERVPIDAVQPYPDNPHKGDVEGVAKSLARYGQWRQILIQRSTGYIVAGNTTWKSAKRLNWASILVTYLDLDTVTAESILLADNAWSARGTDDKDAVAQMLRRIHDAGAFSDAIGYSHRQLDAFLASLRPKDPDATPEIGAITVKPGDAFMLGEHRLICGDSTDPMILARLFANGADPAFRADCVFTSPPYAVDVDYGTYEDTISNLRPLLRRSAERWLDILRPGGFAVVNFNDIVTGGEAAGVKGVCEYPMALEYWPAFRDAGWVLWSRRVWCKPSARTHAPWTRPSNRAASNFEHLWTWKAPGDPIVKRVDGVLASPEGWIDSSAVGALEVGKSEHGAAMPSWVAGRMIGIHSERDGIVFEPFSGTGTTIIAAEQLDRRCFAAELEPRFVQMAIARWEAFTSKTAVRLR